jgi:hypothetical protein
MIENKSFVQANFRKFFEEKMSPEFNLIMLIETQDLIVENTKTLLHLC